jgi:hypothetical protein
LPVASNFGRLTIGEIWICNACYRVEYQPFIPPDEVLFSSNAPFSAAC